MMDSDREPVWVGDLRPSQLLYTFGIGAMLDLPRLSVLIMGLDDWRTTYGRVLTEERLLAAIQSRLGRQVRALRQPPVAPDEQNGVVNPHGASVGVPVAPFPGWARCPHCERLAPINSGLFKLKTVPFHPESARYLHVNCNKASKPPVLPVRFVLACRNGHLDDFPWNEYVHRWQPCPEKQPRLRLREYGVSGEASDVWVYCDQCGARRRMGDAVTFENPHVLPPCRGWHPHIRLHAESPCAEPVRVTVLGASNTWFPITLSAISIPASTAVVDQVIEAHWGDLQTIESIEVLDAFRKTPLFAPIFTQLSDFSNAEIWEAVRRQRNTQTEEAPVVVDLKTPEWEAFSEPRDDLRAPDFELRTVDPPRGYERYIAKTVLVERIREVRALMSFTRIESPGELMDETELPPERRAPLSTGPPTWLPALEVKGEGIFLHFKESVLKQWRAQPEVIRRSREFFTGHRRWREMRNIQPNDSGFPGIRYVLLHSFAHALMRQLALECGYTAASIRERIYASEDNESPMAGILLYTAANDSEGTLGGLVSLGQPKPLGGFIDQALEDMRLCASDPMCSDHSPAEDDVTIHGAACHACLFAPETACERGNKYLDRSTLVRTFSMEGVGLFDG